MERAAQDSLRLSEIYRSIQGESTWAGALCVFIRLTGCNLHCTWCDTEHARGGGKKTAIRKILESVADYGIPLVEITGGEPLVHANTAILARQLLERDYTVLVETNGSLPIDALPAQAIKIMDVKCPSSGMSEHNHWPNLERLAPERDEVKFVIADRDDYDYARGVVERHALDTRCKAVLFSPESGTLDPRLLAEWILEDVLPVRFQLQLHKLIWPPGQRGV